MLFKRRMQSVLLVCLWSAGACNDGDISGPGDDGGTEQPDGGSSLSKEAKIRGRVTSVDGTALAGVEVEADGEKAMTDAKGRFTLNVEADKEVRVSVRSDRYSGAAVPARASKQAEAQLDLAVKERSSLKFGAAEKGGRVQAEDGFAVELPAQALLDGASAPVRGEVEVRYAVIKDASDVTAAPGKLQAATTKQGLDGLGLAELRFYKDGKRVTLAKEIQVELPMHADHTLRDGDEVDLYELGAADTRWKQSQRAKVQGEKLVVKTRRDEWLGAATALPATSCVKGRLGLSTDATKDVPNTTIRAARERGLSLVQAETLEDGSFCLPVTPDDDWRVSTYYDDGSAAFGLQVDLNSSDAAGMCGGEAGAGGCKDLGDVALPMAP